MGPYGTPLVNDGIYSHVVAIGAGTGIVPLVSLLKKHINQMLLMDPESFLVGAMEKEKRNIVIRCAKESKNGSILQQVVSALWNKETPGKNDEAAQGSLNLRQSITAHNIQSNLTSITMTPSAEPGKGSKVSHRLLRRAVFDATKSTYFSIIQMLFTMYGVVVFGLGLSWSLTTAEVYNSMATVINALTLILHGLFLVATLFIW